MLRHEIFAELRVIPGFVDRLRAMITAIDENGVESHIAPVVAGRRRGVGVVMSQPLEFVRPFDPASITTLLLDADDNLFPFGVAGVRRLG